MAALDDYKSSAPTWLVVLRILGGSAAPRILSELSDEVYRRTNGRKGRDASLLLRLLKRMRDDGLVSTEEVRRGRRRILSGYVITDAGNAFVDEGLADFRGQLGLQA